MGRYPSDVGIVNGGWMDAWNTAREPGFGMAYFDRTDLPFYYAMADAWTVGDQYAAPFPQCVFVTSCAGTSRARSRRPTPTGSSCSAAATATATRPLPSVY